MSGFSGGGGGGVTDHTLLTNIGTNTHAQVDTQFATTIPATYAPIAKGVTNGDTHDHVGGDGAAIAGIVPANLIAYTTDGSAPTGWAIYTALYGRFVVGFNTNITSTVGTALTTLENRNHSHTGPSHQHTETFAYDGGTNIDFSLTSPFGNGVNLSITKNLAQNVESATIAGLLVNASGTGATGTAATGDTAPYIQLLPIQRSA